jgi:hypothetical protein
MTVLTIPIPAGAQAPGAQAPLGYPVPEAPLPAKQSFASRIPKQSLGTSRTRLTADVVTGKLDVREAAAALPEVDPLAADDEPDSLDAGTETDLAEPDVASEEADA